MSVRLPRPSWRMVGIAVSLILLVAALFALHRILAEVHLADVLKRFRETSLTSVILALVCVAGSYVTLIGYEVLALRHLGKPMPYGKAALASFTGYAFSHNIGLSLLTGGSIRYRIYSGSGVSATEIAMLIGICTLTYGLGEGLLLGLALIAEPTILSVADAISPAINRTIGAAILFGVAGYTVWTGFRKRPLTLRNWSLPVPGLRMTLGQLALSVGDVVFAAATLYLLLPPGLDISFPAFVGIYVAAVTIGLLSHSPGGVGVFEAIMLLALPGADKGSLLGALLVYRCLYYLLPLALAAGLLAWHEYRRRR